MARLGCVCDRVFTEKERDALHCLFHLGRETGSPLMRLIRRSTKEETYDDSET